jgi:DNA-binding HxlR family transcriptional regulator
MRERNYRQNCGVARAADLLGERWTLLIVRDLLIAPRRFSELERRMKGMGTNLLAKRLREMRAGGVVTGGPNYGLTEMGRGLEPLILGLAKWSLKWQRRPHQSDGIHYPDWDLLALKALFMPNLKRRKVITACFTSDDWSGWMRIDRSSCTFGTGYPPTNPDVKFQCLIGDLVNPTQVIEQLPPRERRTATEFVAAFRLG